MSAPGMVTVWEVLYDGAAGGAACDDTHVARFRSKAHAVEFARGRTCWGSPATVGEPGEVSRKTARRWGLIS